MLRRQQPEERFTVRLTLAQRKTLAELLPTLADRLKLDEKGQRAVEFTLAELRQVKDKASTGITQDVSGVKRNSLRHVVDAAQVALERPQEKVSQLKITLLDTKPPIWRRVQVKDCTLDKLHEHIQTAMGWTNSHLHHFRVGEQLYGDPELMQENLEDMDYKDSTATKLREIVRRTAKRFRFLYEYDFGDSWQHEVLVEGVLGGEPKAKYPLPGRGTGLSTGGLWRGLGLRRLRGGDPEHR